MTSVEAGVEELETKEMCVEEIWGHEHLAQVCPTPLINLQQVCREQETEQQQGGPIRGAVTTSQTKLIFKNYL